MRFSAVFVASALGAVAVAQSTTETSASPTQSVDASQASILACLDDCSLDDVDCRARCNPVPNPSEEQIMNTDKCVGECDQGDGSEAETERYTECRNKCIADNYYNTSEGTPRATGAPGGSNNNNSDDDDDESSAGSPTNSAGNSDSTGSSDDDDDNNESSNSDSDDSSTSTGSGDAAEETEDSPDAATQLVGSGIAAFVALAAAAFAL